MSRLLFEEIQYLIYNLSTFIKCLHNFCVMEANTFTPLVLCVATLLKMVLEVGFWTVSLSYSDNKLFPFTCR